MILNDGRVGDTYNIGGDSEVTNIEVVRSICALLDVYAPAVLGTKPESYSYSDLITYITDRPGHDKRYAIDASKLWRELGWRPSKNFKSGLRQTVGWYLIHRDWVHKVQDKQ
jgi:dTDP-glucose 4,6-dehydratase